jgi:P pilus assembly chaperone PapD
MTKFVKVTIAGAASLALLAGPVTAAVTIDQTTPEYVSEAKNQATINLTVSGMR